MWLIVIIIGIIVFHPHSVSALEQVVINEFTVEPEQKIELWNASSESIDISNWYLDDAGGTTYFTVPVGSIIIPGTCMVFSENINLNKSTPDTIRLFDTTAPPTSASALMVDSYSYPKSPGQSVSWMRQNDAGEQWSTGSASIGYSNTTGATCVVPPPILTTPTPQQTFTPEPSPAATQPENTECVILSEVMAYPVPGEPEWVELHNICTREVVFDDWFIDDIKDGGSAPRQISMTLSASGYGSITIPTGMFNNAGDTVNLYDANENVVDSHEYDTAQRDISLSRQPNGSWCLTSPSKNAPNDTCKPANISANTTPTAFPTPSPTAHEVEPVLSDVTIILTQYPLPETQSEVLGTSKQQTPTYKKQSPPSKLLLLYCLLAFGSFVTCVAKICYTFYHVRLSQTSVRPS